MSAQGRSVTKAADRARPRRPKAPELEPRVATETQRPGVALDRIGASYGTPVDRFRLLLQELGLTDWEVVDDGETAGDDCAAAVIPSDDYHVVRFATSRPNFPHDNPNEALRVLLHEAVHVLVADYSHAAEAAAAGLPEPAKTLAETHLRRQEELLADRLATIFIGYRRRDDEQ